MPREEYQPVSYIGSRPEEIAVLRFHGRVPSNAELLAALGKGKSRFWLDLRFPTRQPLAISVDFTRKKEFVLQLYLPDEMSERESDRVDSKLDEYFHSHPEHAMPQRVETQLPEEFFGTEQDNRAAFEAIAAYVREKKEDFHDPLNPNATPAEKEEAAKQRAQQRLCHLGKEFHERQVAAQQREQGGRNEKNGDSGPSSSRSGRCAERPDGGE